MNWLRPVAKLYGTAALICLGILGLQSERGQALLGRSGFVRYIDNDDSTYYRLKVKLDYKGEEQDFDIVVGCHVRVIGYKDGGTTREAGLIPSVFGRRMMDGKGLVVRPPDACDGETTANGRVEPDLLPIIVVYDNADTLDFGTAYLSEDAYESPLSVLTFGGATIESASRGDFLKFRRTQKNLVTRASYLSVSYGPEALERMGLTPPQVPFGQACEGYHRFIIPDRLRSLVRQHWPENRPKYWIADTYQFERAVFAEFKDINSANAQDFAIRSDRQTDPPHIFSEFFYPGDHAADIGAPTRTGGGLVASGRGGLFPSAYYPAATDYRRDQWPLDPKEWDHFVAGHGKFADTNIDYRGGQAKGFSYCFSEAVPGNENAAMHGENQFAGRVDGVEISSKLPTSGPFGRPQWIFEGDQYAYWFFRLNLGSMRGDV